VLDSASRLSLCKSTSSDTVKLDLMLLKEGIERWLKAFADQTVALTE
jgi:hypothetical protein